MLYVPPRLSLALSLTQNCGAELAIARARRYFRVSSGDGVVVSKVRIDALARSIRPATKRGTPLVDVEDVLGPGRTSADLTVRIAMRHTHVERLTFQARFSRQGFEIETGEAGLP